MQFIMACRRGDSTVLFGVFSSIDRMGETIGFAKMCALMEHNACRSKNRYGPRTVNEEHGTKNGEQGGKNGT